MKGFYITAIKRNSGKTTLSIAISRLLCEKGFKVVTFKKGPDYIDPMWLKKASKSKCYNIDFFFHKNNIKNYFLEKSNNADFVIVEGNHGLFDDIGVMGKKSNASLSKMLGLPVILVVDVCELGRSVVSIILGCQQFDKKLNISGIILNRVQSERHRKKLLDAIKKYINIPVLGVIPDNKNISIKQRHLGLSAHLTKDNMDKKIALLSSAIKPYIDIDAIISSALNVDTHLYESSSYKEKKHNKLIRKKKVGICFDRAFNFYYENNIEIIKKCDSKLVYISPLRDKSLPDIDFVYIGGGFPELFASILEKNHTFKESLCNAIENGLSVYAECGGLIYLSDALVYKGNCFKMLGLIKARAVFQEKPVAHNYTILKKNTDLSMNLSNYPHYIRGHEFHHFYLEGLRNYDFAFKVLRGKGINGYDGIIYKNVLANFTHIYDFGKYSFFDTMINH